MSTTKTNGLQALEELEDELGINSHNVNKKYKRQGCLKTSKIEEYTGFDPNNDAFSMTTQMVKRVGLVFETFKDNVECNIQFGTNGITVFALYYDKTVCICTHLGKDLFSEFSCEKETLSCVNLNVFAKRLSTLQRFKPQKLTFSNEDQNLIITGYPEKGPSGKVIISSLTSVLEELDPSSFEYDVHIRVLSSDFAKRIDAMPPTFILRMDCDSNHLVFEGVEDLSSIVLRLEIDVEIVKEIEKFNDVANYRASFMKSYLQPIIKGAKLSTYAIISFRRDSPLFVRYIINESSDMNPENNSKISMYFSSKFDDDLEDE